MSGSGTSYNITYDVASPYIIEQYPWDLCYTDSGCFPYGSVNTLDTFGQGVGYASGSNSSGGFGGIKFYGDAVFIYGSAPSSSSYRVQVDNSSQVISAGPSIEPISIQSPDLLFWEKFLEPDNHQIGIFASGPVNVTSFVVSSPLTSHLLPTTAPYWDIAITYIGEWSIEDVTGLPNGTMTTTDFNASATFQFTGEGVILYGSLPTSARYYNVTLDGVNLWKASNVPFQIPQSVLFAAGGLNTSVQHSLTLANDGQRPLSLTSVAVIGQIGNTSAIPATPSSTSSSSSGSTTMSLGSSGSSPPTPSGTSGSSSGFSISSSSSTHDIGAITGGVIGGLVFLCLLGLILFYLVRRTRKPNPPTSPMASDDPGLEPYNAEKFSSPSRTASATVMPYYLPSPPTASQSPGLAQASNLDSARTTSLPLPPPRALPAISTFRAGSGISVSQPSALADSFDYAYTRPEPTSDDVDRMVELIAARMDAQRGSGGDELPDYVDRRRPEDR